MLRLSAILDSDSFTNTEVSATQEVKPCMEITDKGINLPPEQDLLHCQARNSKVTPELSYLCMTFCSGCENTQTGETH